MRALTLEGISVGVTADRRAEEQAAMLRERGANVLCGPTIRTQPIDDHHPPREATLGLLRHPPDIVIATTGIGVRAWLSLADSWGVADELTALLDRAYVAVRGPKAAGALASIGADINWRAPSERLDDVIDHLLHRGVSNLRVAVQVDGGGAAGRAALHRLAAGGADLVTVSTYRWTMPEDTAPARKLIDAVCARRLDAITFTSAPALHNLFALAGEDGTTARLRDALSGPVLVMCIGPVCREAAAEQRLTEAKEPPVARLGSMVRALADELDQRRRVLAIEGLGVEVQGAMVSAGGARVLLSTRERAIFDVLAQRPGAVVPRRTLLTDVWGDAGADPHSLEVAVGRLRRRLAPTGMTIEAVLRRGYRLTAR